MKKSTMTIVAVTVAVSMLSFAAFAGNETYEGYEKFKDLLKNEQNTKDYAQGNGSVIITDNDETILTVSGEFIGNKEMKEGYGNIHIQSDEVDKSLEVFGQDEKMYIVDGENVYSGTHDEEDRRSNRGNRKYDRDKDFDAKSEALLDVFMADFKDDFTLEGDTIIFELTKEEMPALLNIMMSEDIDHKNEMKRDMTSEELAGYPLFEELKTLKDAVPELTEKELEYIKVVLDVENNEIKGIQISLIVKGLDENNDEHVVEVEADFNKSETPLEIKTFELIDQNVYEIKDRN